MLTKKLQSLLRMQAMLLCWSVAIAVGVMSSLLVAFVVVVVVVAVT